MSKKTLINALDNYRVEINFRDNKYSQTDIDVIKKQIDVCEKNIRQATTVEEVFSLENYSILSKAVDCAIEHHRIECPSEDKEILKELNRYSNLLKDMAEK